MVKKKGKKSAAPTKNPATEPSEADPAPSEPQPGVSGGGVEKRKDEGKKREATPEVVQDPRTQKEKRTTEEQKATPEVVQEPRKQKGKRKTEEQATPEVLPPEVVQEPRKQKGKKKAAIVVQEPSGPPSKERIREKTPTLLEPSGPPPKQRQIEGPRRMGPAGDASQAESGAGLGRGSRQPLETGRGSGQSSGFGPGPAGDGRGVGLQSSQTGMRDPPASQRGAPRAQVRQPPVLESPVQQGHLQAKPAWGPGPRQATQMEGPAVQVVPPRQPAVQQRVQVSEPTKPVAMQALVKDMSKMCLSIPPRRNKTKAGTMGRPIVVETNHLSLNLKGLKNAIAVHYDVHLDPDKPKRLLRPAMIEFQRKHYPRNWGGFDGRKNLYSSGKLPFGDEIMDPEIIVRDSESQQEMTFKVKVKLVALVDMTTLNRYMAEGSSLNAPQEAIQVIDVVLREVASRSFLQVGRSFFTPPTNRVVNLGDGHELWYGFYQSAILGWKPYINIDVAHKGFPKAQPVIDLICELTRLRYNDLHQELDTLKKHDISRFLKGLKIEYEIPKQPNSKRCYRVNGLVACPRNNRFNLEDGRSISVQEYFETQKKYRLSFPYMPCLHVGSPTRPNPIYVPAELCTIIRGQVVMRKLTETQTQNMIKCAATDTVARKNKILDALNRVGFNQSNVVREFGLSIGGSFERVNARVLKPPQLEYSNNQLALPKSGVWHAATFLDGQNLMKWAIFNLGRRTTEADLQGFIQQIKKVGRGLGMVISDPVLVKTVERYNPKDKSIETFLNDCKKLVTQLVVVVVPEFPAGVYAKVKKVAELNLGVLTQCIKDKTMTTRMNPATVSNILLKVNSKLNGINHTLPLGSRPPCLRVPVMIVGADVTHPSPDQTDIPSVAAVCASHEPKAFKYNIQYRLQPPRVEIIQDLEQIMRAQLLFFYNANKGQIPQRIIFYRDGVSEGQFLQVMNIELMAIRRACQGMSPDYKPQITFLVVQKRHHTRFFPTKKEDEDGRNMNVPPGTIVDTDITHPTELDFYLVSHASIQGVSRPTKYCRLWDDSNMSEDELENLTYYLCHLFSRCTRSVSYPAPTYYAHLMAYRARVYLEGEPIQLGSLEREQAMRVIKDEIQNKCPMFFV